MKWFETLRSIALIVLLAFSTVGYSVKKHSSGVVPVPTDASSQATPSPDPDADANPTARPKADQANLKANPTAESSAKLGSPTVGLRHCDDKHPIETFVQIASATAPQADPQGGVYFISDMRDAPQVFHLRSESAWPEQVSFFPDGVPYFRLSPDGLKLLIATQVGGDEQYDIYLLEPKTKKLTPLLVGRNKRIESIAWEAHSRWFTYTSNERDEIDLDLYRYDLEKKKGERLTQLSGHNAVTDVAPSGNLIALTNERSSSDTDVLVWNIALRQLTTLTKHEGDQAFQSGKFNGDSSGIFLLSDAEKGFSELYLFPVNAGGGKPTRLLTTGKWGIEGFALSPSRTSLAYVTNEDGYSRIKGFELDRAGRKIGMLPVPVFPAARGSLVGLPSFAFSPSHDRRSFFFSESSSVRSSDIWLWQNPLKKQWTHSTQGLTKQECFTEERLVHYPSFDKRKIPAFLFYPPDAQGPIPFIVYVHGGPESQYRPAFNKIFQYFLERGFGVFAPNIRGSSGYGRDYALLDNYKKRMDAVKDVIEGAKWLLEKRYSLPGELAIYGGSYGGFLVLRSIEVEPDLFSAATESVGIANFVNFLKNTKPYRRALREAEYGPLSDEGFLKSISPITYLDRIKTPLLIFHGANDPRVPVSDSEQIVAELTKRSIPVESKIFPDEGHGNTKLRNIMEQAKTTVYFFEKNLKKKSPESSR